MDAQHIAALTKRIGERHLGKRLRVQVNYSARMFVLHNSFRNFHYENSDFFNDFVTLGLKASLMYQRGVKNSLGYRLREHEFVFSHLPSAFDGFRILHLSDIHADGIADGALELCRILRDISADICVITGDYRFMTHSSYQKSIDVMADIIGALNVSMGKWGILGNHDFIEFVSFLEQAGLPLLLNEAVVLEKDGARIWLAGVDDDHLYHCADLGRTLSAIPAEEMVVLLSHTPELYKKAALEEVDLFLCGHTHGGQICLPGGVPLITNASCPRRLCAGRWRCQNMQGYTSSGTGSSGVPVRFNCPPEIAVHTLRKHKSRRRPYAESQE